MVMCLAVRSLIHVFAELPDRDSTADRITGDVARTDLLKQISVPA
jgi:hypothetical protein